MEDEVQVSLSKLNRNLLKDPGLLLSNQEPLHIQHPLFIKVTAKSAIILSSLQHVEHLSHSQDRMTYYHNLVRTLLALLLSKMKPTVCQSRTSHRQLTLRYLACVQVSILLRRDVSRYSNPSISSRLSKHRQQHHNHNCRRSLFNSRNLNSIRHLQTIIVPYQHSRQYSRMVLK